MLPQSITIILDDRSSVGLDSVLDINRTLQERKRKLESVTYHLPNDTHYTVFANGSFDFNGVRLEFPETGAEPIQLLYFHRKQGEYHAFESRAVPPTPHLVSVGLGFDGPMRRRLLLFPVEDDQPIRME